MKFFYNSLHNKNQVIFPVWGMRVFFFFGAWEDVWDKILTIDIMRRGWLMTNKCSLCKAGGESTNLILIYYKKTKKMYDMLLAIPRL